MDRNDEQEAAAREAALDWSKGAKVVLTEAAYEQLEQERKNPTPLPQAVIDLARKYGGKDGRG